MIRAIIQSVVEGVIKRFTASGRPDETISNREYFQHYGFTSRPLAGAEAVIIQEGNHIVMIASDDRRYRIAIDAGEVCIYTDEGDHIRFKRGKEIYIKSGNKLNADIANDVIISTKNAVVNASTKCQVNSPEINLSGDRAGLRRFIDDRFRELFNAHTHSGCGGTVNSGPPTSTLEYASHATDIVRGA
jgi:phage gp45-like